MHLNEQEAPHELSMSVSALKGFMAERRQSMWLIAANFRPGAAVFSAYIEYTLYPPGTDKNDSFEVLEIPWEGILWCVLGVPLRDLIMIKKIAGYCGLRVGDGVPSIVEVGKDGVRTSQFPMNTRRCFTLESTKESGIHGLSPAHLAHIAQVEKRLCSKIWEQDWRPHPRRIQVALQQAVRDRRFADQRTPGHP